MDNKLKLAHAAKLAKPKMAALSSEKKDRILNAMADALLADSHLILEANKNDVSAAREKGVTKAFLDRLSLDSRRIENMAADLRAVSRLKDPIGEVLGGDTRPNGLKIQKRRVPLGVICVIYEARPNVTTDALGLCVKSGNPVILRGGSEALNTNIAIAYITIKAAEEAGLPLGGASLLPDTSREAAKYMMTLNEYIDVLIPRGGAGLIKSVIENATVPVIETGVGNCHIFVDSSANFEMAAKIIINAKTSRPAVCNAAESLLIHKDIADEFLPYIFEKLSVHNVEVRGCRVCQKHGAKPATEEDYAAEYLDLIISAKVVEGVGDAIRHINKYSTGHSEAIITESYKSAQRFKDEVDSAAVYVNASTRFTDGYEFGMGAEIGISTQRLHARGPMGLEALTTVKYVIDGNGQIR